MKGKTKSRLFVGWGRLTAGIITCAILVAVIVALAILLSKDGVVEELKIIAPIAISLSSLALIYAILRFASNVAIFDDGFKFFGFEFIGDGLTEILFKKSKEKYRFVKFAGSLKFDDIDSVYVVKDDDIPFTLPKKYLIINMKSGLPYRLPLSDFSDASVQKIKESIISNCGCAENTDRQ